MEGAGDLAGKAESGGEGTRLPFDVDEVVRIFGEKGTQHRGTGLRSRAGPSPRHITCFVRCWG